MGVATYPVLEGELIVRDDAVVVSTSKLARARNIASNSRVVKIAIALVLLVVAASLATGSGPFSPRRIGSTLLLTTGLSIAVLGVLYAAASRGPRSSASEISVSDVHRAAVKERGSLRAPLLVVEYEGESGETLYRPVALQPYWFDDRTANDEILSALRSVGVPIETDPDWE